MNPQAIASKEDAECIPVGADGKRDYSKSLAQLRHPDKQFDSDITIYFRNVNIKVSVSQGGNVPITPLSPITGIYDAIKTGGKSLMPKDFYRIKNVSGIIRPATMTLVLSAPGEGKSSYLRALGNRIPITSGRVVYNGRDTYAAAREGCDLRKMTQYVDQVDSHLATLTVQETLDFAHKMSSVHYDPQRVEDVITLLGLESCVDTVIGDKMVKGISGGQMKRVSTGEMLVSDASILFLDEFSNGLDSSTAEDIARGLRTWCRDTNCSVVATLQQPTPEMFELFDRLVILRQGQVVYDGPRADILAFLAAMHFNAPDDVDTCDYIIDCLTQARHVVMRQRELELHHKKHGRHVPPPSLQSSYGLLELSPEPCITIEQMREYYETTPQWKEINDELLAQIPTTVDAKGKDVFQPIDLNQCKPLMPTTHSKEMYHTGYRLPVLLMLIYVVHRQALLLSRATATIIPRFINAIVMSFIYGGLYYNLKHDNYITILSSLVVAISNISFSSFIEIPSTVAGSRVMNKQTAARFYPAWCNIVSMALLGIPMVFVESIFYSVIMYWLNGHYPGALEFFVFFFTLILQGLQLSAWFRMLTAFGKDETTAQSLAGPSTGVFMLFAGLFVQYHVLVNNPRSKWLVFLFWVSPFSWSVRALGNSQFNSARYDALILTTKNGQTVLERSGTIYLESIDMFIGSKWIIAAMGYLVGLMICCVIFHSWLVTREFYEESIGTRREDDNQDGIDEETEEQRLQNDAAAPDEDVRAQITAAAYQQTIQLQENSKVDSAADHVVSVKSSSFGGTSLGGSSSLPTLREAVAFNPAWMSFSDVYYTVKVQKDGQTIDRVLLAGVSGYAQPGKMLALMGASGAGKTTLLDVLSGRKNTGKVEGKILLNGQEATPALVAQLCGYVEQFDSLFPYSTVLETLRFAARLRLPAHVADSVKCKIVDEILDILDLTSISEYMLGNHAIPGLSPSQLKRVNIGVELVANPSVLFLDEPTTGLDSRSAQVVMRAVKRISKSGRSIVCTIHQPSAELFYLFDRLVLLGSGGHQIYFGDLGFRSKTFVSYLSSCPGVSPIRARYNPASWMLQELGVGVASQKGDLEAAMAAKAAASDTPTDPRFQIKDEPEWADLSSQDRTVQRFKKIYFQSATFEKAHERLQILESIKLVKSDDQDQLAQQHDQAAERVRQNEEKLAAAQGGEASVTKLPTSAVVLRPHRRPDPFTQIALLINRNWYSYWRNYPFLIARFGVATIISVIFGLVYLKLHVDSQTTAISLFAGCFLPISFGGLIGAMTALPNIFELRPCQGRESSSGTYYVGLVPVASLLLELVWCALSAIVITIPAYWMLGMVADFGVFMSYIFMVYLACLAFLSMTMFYAAVTPNSAIAQVLQGSSFSLISIFNGISITQKNMGKGWFFQYINCALHVAQAVTMPQFKDNHTPFLYFNGLEYVPTTVRGYIQIYSGWSYGWDEYAWQILWIFCWIAFCQFFAFVGTTFLRWDKR